MGWDNTTVIYHEVLCRWGIYKECTVIVMSLWHGKSRKKKSGGRRHFARKKKKHEMGSDVTHTVLDETSRKFRRTMGGHRKAVLLADMWANAYDPSDGKTKRTKIINVASNPANPHYVRRNIITKGAVVETELGKGRVTARPGQHGVINVYLFKSPKK